MFQADPWGILTLVAVAMCWALAITLFRVGVPGSTARKLALLLFVEGVTLGFSGASYSLFVSINDTFSQYPLLETIEKFVHTLGDCALLALYPAFLAGALQTRLTRPFANKRVQLGLAGYAAMLFFAVMYAPFTVGFTLLYLSLALVFGFALVASIQAWRIATGAARQRALIFVLAFGFRDL